MEYVKTRGETLPEAAILAYFNDCAAQLLETRAQHHGTYASLPPSPHSSKMAAGLAVVRGRGLLGIWSGGIQPSSVVDVRSFLFF